MSEHDDQTVNFTEFKKNRQYYFDQIAGGKTLKVAYNYNAEGHRRKITLEFGPAPKAEMPSLDILPKDVPFDPRLALCIADIAPIKARTLGYLQSNRMIYVGDVARLSEREFIMQRDLGLHEAAEIHDKVLKPLGLDWETDVDPSFDDHRPDPKLEIRTVCYDYGTIANMPGTFLIKKFGAAQNNQILVKGPDGHNIAVARVSFDV